MSHDLSIRCRCGQFCGRAVGVASHRGRRAVCYCRDCRMFAHFLGAADAVLDPHGGTEVLQESQAGLRIESGGDQLACMRLTPRGLLRWYTACCGTPIGNVLPTRQLPYLGLIHACIDQDRIGEPLEAVLGPIRFRVHGRHIDTGPHGPAVSDGIPPLAVAIVGARMLGWRLRGDHRHSPFFDPRTGQPVAPPRVLRRAEHDTLRARADAALYPRARHPSTPKRDAHH